MVEFLNKNKKIIEHHIFRKFCCLDCKAEIWQLDSADNSFPTETTKGCKHFPEKLNTPIYVKVGSDKKTEKVGNIRI